MSFDMDTVVIGFAGTWLLLRGSIRFRAFGLISVDVSMKKRSSRKIISVIPDTL